MYFSLSNSAQLLVYSYCSQSEQTYNSFYGHNPWIKKHCSIVFFTYVFISSDPNKLQHDYI